MKKECKKIDESQWLASLPAKPKASQKTAHNNMLFFNFGAKGQLFP